MLIQPLAEVPISPVIASLPKADLHIHQEEVARFERVVARRQRRQPYDWRPSAQQLLKMPPGGGRLGAMYAPDATLDLDSMPSDAPEDIVAKIVDALEEGASDGAVLVEVHFGAGSVAFLRPDFMYLFREAERRVQARYPRLFAEAISYLSLVNEPVQLHVVERQLEVCLRMAAKGLGGVDFRIDPYDTEADPSLWRIVYNMAERAADAGLGITVHAGEFSTANLAAALQVPSLQRLGHAVYAAADRGLLEQLARNAVTVECCLSCNVVLGAVPSYEAHPIWQFVASDIPITLNTDNPVRICTTIGREYAIAEALGFAPHDLAAFTRNAIKASFTSPTRRDVLLDEVLRWEASLRIP